MPASNLPIVIRLSRAALLAASLLTLLAGQARADTIEPPTISDAFSFATIQLNADAFLTFTITNPNSATDALGVAFFDVLPAGLVVSTPNDLTGDCGGTATAVSNGFTISLSGGSIGAGKSCTVSVLVTGTTIGVKNNVSGPVSSTNGGNGTASNVATIDVVPFTSAPEPGTIFLLSSAFLGLGLVRKRTESSRS